MENIENFHKLIDMKIVRINTTLTIPYTRLHIDGVTKITNEEDFLISEISLDKTIKMQSVYDKAEVIMVYDDVTYIDGMKIDRLSEAYRI